MEVPASLRRWFMAHFVVDLLAGVPLLLDPQTVLGWLHWPCVDPSTARLCGAALLAIGTTSWRTRDDSVDVYKVMLDLKIIWSLAAIAGLFVSIGENAPPAVWAFMSAFIAFSGVWIHHRIRFKQMDGAARLDD